MTPGELLYAATQATEIFDESFTLVKNQVGNLAILGPSGEFVGYVDLGNGQVVDLRQS